MSAVSRSAELVEIDTVVESVEVIAEDVLLVTLRAAGAGTGAATAGADAGADALLPAWTPGAHLDVVVRPGVERQYSLCGDPADRSRYQVAVLREPAGRGGSEYLHAHLAVGDTLRVRGPLNHFELSVPPPGTPLSPRYVFVAGGIGITPILPMIEAVEAAGLPWELHYAGRSRGRMAFVDSLVARYGSRVSVYAADSVGSAADSAGSGGAASADASDAADAADASDGALARGALARGALARGALARGALARGERLDLTSLSGGSIAAPVAVYCCGPVRMLDALEGVAAAAGWPVGALHLERFEAKAVAEPVRQEAFEVELELSGLTLEVPPDRSILDVVEEAGVLVLSSCREGTCGTCETPVVSGEVDHRDSVLTPDEQEADELMMICVSRAACPRLVLEL